MGIEETQQVRLRRAATGRRRDARDLGADAGAPRDPLTACRSPLPCSTTPMTPTSRSAAAARLLGRSLEVPMEPPMK